MSILEIVLIAWLVGTHVLLHRSIVRTLYWKDLTKRAMHQMETKFLAPIKDGLMEFEETVTDEQWAAMDDDAKAYVESMRTFFEHYGEFEPSSDE